MITATGTLTFADAARDAPVYAGAERVAMRMGAAARVTAETDKRLEWVAQIQAVRDRQDQAAFAALFRHFAPRVKGFLIKGGAAPDQWRKK